MKKRLNSFFIFILISISAYAQTNSFINYQAILRNPNGTPRENVPVVVDIIILRSATSNQAVYAEKHYTSTNGLGLISLKIGQGESYNGNFSSIQWGGTPYFTKILVDGEEIGTSELASVPTAIYSDKAGHAETASYASSAGNIPDVSSLIPNPKKKSQGNILWFDGNSWIAKTVVIPDVDTLIVDPKTKNQDDLLSYNGTKWVAKTVVIPNADTLIANPTTKSNNDLLSYNGTKWVAKTVVIPNADTLIANPTTKSNNDLLSYNGTKWVAKTVVIPNVDTLIANPKIKSKGNFLTYDSTNWVAKSISLAPSGGTQSFSIMQPYLVLNYVICLEGAFPSRNLGTENILGSVDIFAGNFAPRGWELCQGQLMSIARNSALFSILGTTYGGDGQTTFALPDLRGRVVVGAGSGPGLSPQALGEKSGTETTTMQVSNMPAHTHSISILP